MGTRCYEPSQPRRGITGKKKYLLLSQILIHWLYLYFCILSFVHFCCSNGNFPWEIRVAFPQGKPIATESRYPTLIHYKVLPGTGWIKTARGPPTDHKRQQEGRVFRTFSKSRSRSSKGAWVYMSAMHTSTVLSLKALSAIGTLNSSSTHLPSCHDWM